ncbi:MAG TPA: aldehyde dehydrogenase family protein [Acidimicrobiia bacterium]|nr:aldehyde dehydrogenase family protein [Acidimicrobiia bacterium]
MYVHTQDEASGGAWTMRPGVVEADVVLDGGASDAHHVVQVRNPADVEQVVGTYPALEVHHVDRAVDHAVRAQPNWAEATAAERFERLRRGVAAMQDVGELDTLLVREQGKALWEASFEIAFPEAALGALEEHVEWLDAGELVIDDGMGRAWVHSEPFGVVGIITPWNWPYAIPAVKTLPALLAGNAVVLVLAPTAPLAALAGFAALADHLPRGVLSVLTGPGPKIGQRLVEHPAVGKISFTGSTATGRLIAGAASETLKSQVLELGGNDPAVILPDCELDEALFANIVGAAFLTTGQVCMAIKRVYAPASRVDEIAEGVAAILDTFVIGDGLDPDTTMGPLHCQTQRDKVSGLVQAARESGARIRECGDLRGDPERGWFLRPCVVTGIDQAAPLVQEEQFGPALPIIGYGRVDEAVAMANDSPFGLCSSIWTSDESAALPLARRVQAGSTFINNHGLFAVDPRAPFGGMKHSGIGREFGRVGLAAFCEPHTVSTRHL